MTALSLRRAGLYERAAGLVLLATLGLACESKREQESLTASEAPKAEPTGPVVSPEIAEAVAQVAEAPTGASNGESAPPENGILGPERAQKEAPPDAPPKVVVGKVGDAPRLLLGGPEPTEERIGQMTLMVRTGPNSGLPSVAFKFELGSKKPEAGPHPVAIEITDASLAREQLGEVPADLGKDIATMKGSVLEYQAKDGALLGETRVALGKKTDPRMGALLSAAADAFTLVLLSTPKEPIGKGGFWMVTQREKLGLGEVVGYHLVTVENVEPTRATLSVNSKRYLVSNQFQGLPALQFMGSATTDLVMAPGERLPIEGRTQQMTQALLQRENGQPRPVVYDLRALFAFPPKDAPAAAPSAP